MIVNSFPLFFTLALIRPGANSGSTRSPVDCVKLPSSSKMNVREKQKKNKNRTRKNKINSRKQGCQLHCRVHKFKDWGTSNIFTHWQSLQLILWKKKNTTLARIHGRLTNAVVHTGADTLAHTHTPNIYIQKATSIAKLCVISCHRSTGLEACEFVCWGFCVQKCGLLSDCCLKELPAVDINTRWSRSRGFFFCLSRFFSFSCFRSEIISLSARCTSPVFEIEKCANGFFLSIKKKKKQNLNRKIRYNKTTRDRLAVSNETLRQTSESFVLRGQPVYSNNTKREPQKGGRLWCYPREMIIGISFVGRKYRWAVYRKLVPTWVFPLRSRSRCETKTTKLWIIISRRMRRNRNLSFCLENV